MWNDAYLESRILSADPLELIRMLYEAGIDSVREARKHLEARDVRARSHAVGRAVAIVGELEGSLDHRAGGDIARNLAELYQYIRQRLTEGNLRQADGPLAEAERLLETLLEGWKQIQPTQGASVEDVPPAAGMMAGVFGIGSGLEAHTWSA